MGNRLNNSLQGIRNSIKPFVRGVFALKGKQLIILRTFINTLEISKLFINVIALILLIYIIWIKQSSELVI